MGREDGSGAGQAPRPPAKSSCSAARPNGSVEKQIDIPEGRKDDFRREFVNYLGTFRPDDEVEAFPDRCMSADDLNSPRIDPRGKKNIISQTAFPQGALVSVFLSARR